MLHYPRIYLIILQRLYIRVYIVNHTFKLNNYIALIFYIRKYNFRIHKFKNLQFSNKYMSGYRFRCVYKKLKGC